MVDLTRIFYFVFGVLTLVGGIMGYVKANSTASLIAGGLSGLLLIVAGAMISGKPHAALILGLAVSLALVVFFGKSLATNDPNITAEKLRAKRGRAIPMLALSSIGIALSAVGLFKK